MALTVSSETKWDCPSFDKSCRWNRTTLDRQTGALSTYTAVAYNDHGNKSVTFVCVHACVRVCMCMRACVEMFKAGRYCMFL